MRRHNPETGQSRPATRQRGWYRPRGQDQLPDRLASSTRLRATSRATAAVASRRSGARLAKEPITLWRLVRTTRGMATAGRARGEGDLAPDQRRHLVDPEAEDDHGRDHGDGPAGDGRHPPAQ